MEVAYLLNVGTVWINSFSIERGIQVRKNSGNFSNTGSKSLEPFLKYKHENLVEDVEKLDVNDLDELRKRLKSFGALSSQQSVPNLAVLAEEKTYKLYIGGKQTRPDSQSSRQIYVSETNKSRLYCMIADASRKDVRNAVDAASSAFNGWWKRANHNKAQILYFFGENFKTRRNEFVKNLALFTKKSLAECEEEVKACQDVIFYFASVCDKYIGHLTDTSEYGFNLEVSEPLGCVAIICGHDEKNNHPLLDFMLHLVSAIAYGNTVIIVPDQECPTPALDLYEILETSDMPDGVINILSGDKHHLTKYLCEHQQVQSVWYMSDLSNDGGVKESVNLAQKFVKLSSSFNLKKTWLINRSLSIGQNYVNQDYFAQLRSHSTQYKHIQIPMGTIFAN